MSNEGWNSEVWVHGRVLGGRAIGRTACGKGIMDNIECIYVAGMGDGAMNDSEARA